MDDVRIGGDALAEQCRFFDGVVEDWLSEPDVTLACGRWSEGAISEMLPQGRARLLPPLYEGCFVGVREIRLNDAPHHLHVDFGRVHQVRYIVAPSVCFGFKPSFEARFLVLGPGGAPTGHWVLSVMLSCPYDRETLVPSRVRAYLELARRHARERPDLVEFDVEPAARESAEGAQVLELLREVTGLDGAPWPDVIRAIRLDAEPANRGPDIEPPCLPLLEKALRLRDASLVIYRDRTLIEFKTERLDGVHRYVEHGHVSWQIGAFDDHHCHLALGAVTRVLFSAEPVSCQGGGMNYTVWFLTSGPSGNPYRRDGYFSVVLNRPYTGNRPRLDVILPVQELYREFRHCPWVEADAAFLSILASGPPPRRPGPAARDDALKVT